LKFKYIGNQSKMAMDNIEQITGELYNYIHDNTLVKNRNFDNTTMLFKEGFFDSMGFIMLIEFLEKNFAIKTFDQDMIEENFESINAIAKFIQKKQDQTT
jgi:acyl carrier protein